MRREIGRWCLRENVQKFVGCGIYILPVCQSIYVCVRQTSPSSLIALVLVYDKTIYLPINALHDSVQGNALQLVSCSANSK